MSRCHIVESLMWAKLPYQLTFTGNNCYRYCQCQYCQKLSVKTFDWKIDNFHVDRWVSIYFSLESHTNCLDLITKIDFVMSDSAGMIIKMNVKYILMRPPLRYEAVNFRWLLYPPAQVCRWLFLTHMTWQYLNLGCENINFIIFHPMYSSLLLVQMEN